ncbi:MAG: NADH-quinone oxidoreductase subunit [Frankiaceae bacterium]|nr:NADH-quinone oxidoreductase subunit [Frankiaceae bacterium]
MTDVHTEQSGPAQTQHASPQGLTEETRAAAQEIIARYPEGRSRSALLPMLHLVQAEQGYVTPAGIAFCAEVLGLTKAEVGAVATFYTMYKRRPTGEYLLSVCTNLSCQILGGEDIYARLSRRLGVGHDETTADGSITLEHAECLAACDYAPVLTVNYEFFDNQTQESAEELVDALRRGERPHATRGAQVLSFKEISRQLAGFRDPRPEAASVGIAHPDAPTPVDVTGTEDVVGTDIGPAPEAARYGVRDGVTERVLSDEDAAKTYGEPATLDGGAVRAPHSNDADTDPNLKPVKAEDAPAVGATAAPRKAARRPRKATKAAEPGPDAPPDQPTSDTPTSDKPAPDRER